MFLFGLWPRFLGFVLFSAVCFAVSAGETQVWLGDLRVVVFGVVVVFVLLLHRFAYSKDFLSLYRVLSAYSHVRTEPLVRHRPHSRKKKLSCVATVPHVNRVRLLELHGLTGAGVFVAAGATGCATGCAT